MEVKEKREISIITPVILKFGLAVAVSLGGALYYTYLRTKRTNPATAKPEFKNSSGNDCHQADSRIGSVEVKDIDDHAFQNSPKLPSHISIADRTSTGDKDSFALPEFNDFEAECNMSSLSIDNICPTPLLDVNEYKCTDREEHEREIKRLRNKVIILQEKERNLELQLLEYYGIQEQETAVMELQNKLKLNTMEAKLYDLKIESLLLDNRRLEAQVADYANAANELESAKAKIKMLRMKLKFEVERNREQIVKLQDRVMNLQEHEKKVAEIDQERETLKVKLEEMRICNQVLKQENSDLVQKIDYIKMLAPNALDDEVLQLREESERLNQQNEDSRKKIERLQDGRCRDLEELVYLRWINACLRHELRTHNPEGGRSIASMSPRFEEEAKRLILDYANNEGPGLGPGLGGKTPDIDLFSPSPASCVMDESDDLPAKPGKKKLFAKLRRLLRGGKSSVAQTPARAPPLERTVSVDHIPGRLSCEYPSEREDVVKFSRSSSRRSFDLPRSYSRGGKGGSCSRRTNDDESMAGYDGNWSLGAFLQPIDDQDTQNADKEDLLNFLRPVDDQDTQNADKEDLLNFAEALKNCRPKSSRSSICYESS